LASRLLAIQETPRPAQPSQQADPVVAARAEGS